MLMIPAVCLFNSGASDRHSALIMFRLPFITTAFVGVQVSRNIEHVPNLLNYPVVSLGVFTSLFACSFTRFFSMVVVRRIH